MPFPIRTRAEIRDQLLAYWGAEYTARGETLLTSVGSDAYLLASQIAVVQESLEAQAAQTARDILPDQASTSALDRFGVVYNLPRPQGTSSSVTVTVTGTPSTTIAIPTGTQMSFADGTLYGVTSSSVATNFLGVGTISATSVDTGSATSRSVGDVLTFQSAPAGLNPTGTVASVVAGTDEATDDEYRALILTRLQDRPASGNRADWRNWCESYTGTEITRAYVYPLLQPPAVYPGSGTSNVVGCVTVVPMGPPQGDSTVATRIVPDDNANNRVSGGELPLIRGYIEGTHTIAGIPTSSGVQLRPVTMAFGNYTVQAAEGVPVDINIVISVTSAHPPSFTPSPTINVVSSTSSLVVNGNFSPSGTDLSGKVAIIPIGTSAARGGLTTRTLPVGVYDPINFRTAFAMSPVLPTPPVAALTIEGYSPLYEEVRLAIFGFIDSLAPSAPGIPRWPSEDTDVATLYPTRLIAAVLSVPGTLSAVSLSPSSALVPTNPKTVYLLNRLSMRFFV